jgi:hypothetical protein
MEFSNISDYEALQKEFIWSDFASIDKIISQL